MEDIMGRNGEKKEIALLLMPVCFMQEQPGLRAKRDA